MTADLPFKLKLFEAGCQIVAKISKWIKLEYRISKGVTCGWFIHGWTLEVWNHLNLCTECFLSSKWMVQCLRPFSSKHSQAFKAYQWDIRHTIYLCMTDFLDRSCDIHKDENQKLLYQQPKLDSIEVIIHLKVIHVSFWTKYEWYILFWLWKTIFLKVDRNGAEKSIFVEIPRSMLFLRTWVSQGIIQTTY